MKTNLFRKALCFILAASLLLALTACGTNEPPAQTSTKAAETKKETSAPVSTAAPSQEPQPSQSEPSEAPPAETTEPAIETEDDDEWWDDEDPEASVKPYDAPVRPLDNGTPVEIGNIVTFGSYSQSSSGASAPIEWIVLDVQDGKALLLSRYVLDAAQYHGAYETVTWESAA